MCSIGNEDDVFGVMNTAAAQLGVDPRTLLDPYGVAVVVNSASMRALVDSSRGLADIVVMTLAGGDARVLLMRRSTQADHAQLGGVPATRHQY